MVIKTDASLDYGPTANNQVFNKSERGVTVPQSILGCVAGARPSSHHAYVPSR